MPSSRLRGPVVAALVVVFAAPLTAQMCWQESPSLKPAPNSWSGQQGEQYAAYAGSGLAYAGTVYGASRVVGEVYPHVAGGANMGYVGGLPAYGALSSNIPVIGTAAASVPIVPTTLGQLPVLGGVVQSVPVVGPIVAGPPNPVLVGAVAVDTYYLPKTTPGGYTESSMFTMTDFNSPPRLRHYKNYLAPLPYTHPPVYAPATGESRISEEAAEQAASQLGVTGSIDIPY